VGDGVDEEGGVPHGDGGTEEPDHESVAQLVALRCPERLRSLSLIAAGLASTIEVD